MNVMLTRLKLKRGEGKLVEGHEVGPQSPPPVLPKIVVEASASMSHEGERTNMSEDEKVLRKYFFDMSILTWE